MNAPRRRPRSTVLLIGLLLLGLALAAGLDWPGARASQAAPVVQRVQVPNLPEIRRAAELSQAFTAISEAVTPAVVRIQAEHLQRSGEREGLVPPGLRDLFGLPEGHPIPPEGLPQIAGGTGFLVSNNGYILTNNHVIQGADRIRVTLVDKRQFTAEVIGRDPTTDVAVIKVDAENLPAIQMGDSEDARVGEWVLAIGNPGFGDASTLDFTVTSGIISAKGRPLNIIPRELQGENDPAAYYAIEDFIQTDAVINPGNSGGPLVNLEGQVIGINTAIASSSGSYEGYGFAIPVNLARRVMADLVEHGYVRRALLGINIRNVDPEDAEVYGLPAISGVLIEDFSADSPAREAGIERGDVIVGLGGSPVDRVGQLQRLVAQHAPGDEVDVEIVRSGETRSFRIRLTEAELSARPLAVDPLRSRPAEPVSRDLGLQLRDLDASLARQFGLNADDGVLVQAIVPGSPAGRKPIVEGDRVVAVNGREVASARDARSTLRATRSGEIASLLIRGADDRTRIVNIRVP